ncbi:hypothetical protein Fmac_027427 [Flemingia macrophylla]|uniref:F-box domain-containing protein n=1 Tax=Flemingia macrophylla TaxID=520843 RepID=A0ABD1LHX2_9FABA
MLSMQSTSGEPNDAAESGGATAMTLSDVPADVIQAHILTRLDGPTLASAATTCTGLRALASHPLLWARACHATWPSTLSPRVRHVISAFPNGGARSFFADAFPSPSSSAGKLPPPGPDGAPPRLLSAVDLFLGPCVVFSEVAETETVSGWFLCSPFRIDMVEEKDAVRVGVTCEAVEEVRLRWVVVDPAGGRAADVSSGRAVEVRRHWLSGEVEARFATAVGEAACLAVVRWGPEMESIREVSLQMEGVDGVRMNGRDSLVILQSVLLGERQGKTEGGAGYRQFLKMKKERIEGKLRAEGILDMLSLAFAFFAMLLASLLLFSKSN